MGSVVDVIANPTDPWAWAGLVGDIVDVAVPFVAGVGEVVDAVKVAKTAVEVAENIHDAGKAVENVNEAAQATKKSLEAIKTASKTLGKGNNTVYVSYVDDAIEYVGITNDFNRRKNEWKNIRYIEEFVSDLDRNSARIVEQTVIDTFGMAKNGGILADKINSIGIKNPLYKEFELFFETISK